MIKIGITGPMCSGKSFCAKVFEKLGVPVFYSDNVSKELVNTNEDLKSELIKEFGKAIYGEDGKLINSKLREIVFVEGGEDKLKRLNEISHPYVIKEYEKFCEKYSNFNYTLKESAILFEVKLDKMVDKIIYVHASKKTRIERSFKRSGILKNEYNKRMKSQICVLKKILKSDYIIYNNSGDDIISQIKKIDKLLNFDFIN